MTTISGDNIKQVIYGEAAKRYAALGWPVFPIHSVDTTTGNCTCGKEDCSNPGKHPLTANGVKDATTDLAVIESWWIQHPWANVAVSTEDLFVVDVDLRHDGLAQFDDYVKDLLPDTLTSETGSGGNHYFFQRPEDVEVLQNKVGLRAGELHLKGIDIRGDGGYVIVPPSVHYSGNTYGWLDLDLEDIERSDLAVVPQAFLDKFNLNRSASDRPIAPLLERGWYDDVEMAKIQDALTVLPAGDPDIWLMVMMAVHYTGRPEAFDIWDEWSQTTGEGNYDFAANLKRWNSLTPNHMDPRRPDSIFKLAREYDWEPNVARPWTFVNNAGEIVSQQLADGTFIQTGAPVVRKEAETEAPEQPAPAPPKPQGEPEFPMELIGQAGGVIAAMTEYMTETAPRPQPVLNFLAATLLTGTLTDRRFSVGKNGRLNLMGVALGPTACGKDHSRKCIKEICDHLGVTNFLGGENLGSGQAIYTRLTDEPNTLFQIDEFGLMLASVTDPRASKPQAEIMRTLMTLFSSSNTLVHGTEYANKKERKREDIKSPHVYVHGSSVPGEFWKALRSGQTANGFLNRFLVLETKDRYPSLNESQKNISEVPSDIGMWFNSLKGATPAGHTIFGTDTARPEPVVTEPFRIPLSKEAATLMKQFNGAFVEKEMRESEETYCNVIGRIYEQVLKLAAIRAVSSNPGYPEVSTDDINWGIRFAKYSCDLVYYHAKNTIADNEHEADVKDMLRIIRESGERGITDNEFKRAPFLKWKPKHREAIIGILFEADLIRRVDMVKTKGRARRNVTQVRDT